MLNGLTSILAAVGNHTVAVFKALCLGNLRNGFKNFGHVGAVFFAYGVGAEVFDGVTIENIQIPKTIAAMWGVEIEGYDNEKFPSLISAR